MIGTAGHGYFLLSSLMLILPPYCRPLTRDSPWRPPVGLDVVGGMYV